MARFRLSKRTCLRLFLASCIVAAAAYYGWTAFDNFHEVLPGLLYRSGQLSPAHLRARVESKGIRTIINLRGPNPQEKWYREEIASCQSNGLVHIDLPIDSGFPTNDEMREMMQAFETCPKPVLIHCQSGIDRTGIASALACLLLDENSSPELAMEQLTWQYGCLPGRKSRKDKRDFLIAYESWLNDQHLAHSCRYFRGWLQVMMSISDLAQPHHS
ncbi:MAG TPA: dual specificity protein phosphatase family protein [Gemmataceae bacterium]|nr:dual specificity protein phosphatase family protein [Gemmataceae bacterium]